MVLDGNAVRSVDRAAALLLALGDSPGEAGVTELARRLGLHKSTASRLLATLQKRGLVEQDDESGKYRLGLVVIRLAEKAERTLDLRGIVLTMYDARTKLAEQVEKEVRDHFGPKVYRTVVPRTVRISEAPSFGQPVTVFDASSRGALAYRELAKEVSHGATRGPR